MECSGHQSGRLHAAVCLTPRETPMNQASSLNPTLRPDHPSPNVINRAARLSLPPSDLAGHMPLPGFSHLLIEGLSLVRFCRLSLKRRQTITEVTELIGIHLVVVTSSVSLAIDQSCSTIEPCDVLVLFWCFWRQTMRSLETLRHPIVGGSQARSDTPTAIPPVRPSSPPPPLAPISP